MYIRNWRRPQPSEGCFGIQGCCFNAVFNASLLALFVDFHAKNYASRQKKDGERKLDWFGFGFSFSFWWVSAILSLCVSNFLTIKFSWRTWRLGFLCFFGYWEWKCWSDSCYGDWVDQKKNGNIDQTRVMYRNNINKLCTENMVNVWFRVTLLHWIMVKKLVHNIL